MAPKKSLLQLSDIIWNDSSWITPKGWHFEKRMNPRGWCDPVRFERKRISSDGIPYLKRDPSRRLNQQTQMPDRVRQDNWRDPLSSHYHKAMTHGWFSVGVIADGYLKIGATAKGLKKDGKLDGFHRYHNGWVMKAIKIAVIMILVLNGLFSLVGWLTNDGVSRSRESQALVDPIGSEMIAAADGLSLPALTALVKSIRSGQELERKLNEPGGINNLDLNADQRVDYLFVTEFGDAADKIGYSLTAQPVKDEIQEIATVMVERNGDRAEIQVIGNEQLYGAEAIYNDWTLVERTAATDPAAPSDMPMHTSYFHSHPLWISPWFFGFYPPYFAFFPIVGPSVYASRMDRQYPTGSVGRGANAYQRTSAKTIQNPNQGKTASRGIARSLKRPTSTQKQFQATQQRNLRSGGFGQATAGRQTSASTQRTAVGSSGTRGTDTTATRSRSLGASAFDRNTTNVNRRSTIFSSGSVRSRSIGSRGFRVRRR
jgi:SOS response regulatory protein OraA/RecX